MNPLKSKPVSDKSERDSVDIRRKCWGPYMTDNGMIIVQKLTRHEGSEDPNNDLPMEMLRIPGNAETPRLPMRTSSLRMSRMLDSSREGRDTAQQNSEPIS